MFALGLTDLDLLDLGEILIAEDENNVAGFPSPFYNVAGFLILFVVLLKTMWQVFKFFSPFCCFIETFGSLFSFFTMYQVFSPFFQCGRFFNPFLQ